MDVLAENFGKESLNFLLQKARLDAPCCLKLPTWTEELPGLAPKGKAYLPTIIVLGRTLKLRGVVRLGIAEKGCLKIRCDINRLEEKTDYFNVYLGLTSRYRKSVPWLQVGTPIFGCWSLIEGERTPWRKAGSVAGATATRRWESLQWCLVANDGVVVWQVAPLLEPLWRVCSRYWSGIEMCVHVAMPIIGCKKLRSSNQGRGFDDVWKMFWVLGCCVWVLRLLSDSDPAVGHLAKKVRPRFKELNRKDFRLNVMWDNDVAEKIIWIFWDNLLNFIFVSCSSYVYFLPPPGLMLGELLVASPTILEVPIKAPSQVGQPFTLSRWAPAFCRCFFVDKYIDVGEISMLDWRFR